MKTTLEVRWFVRGMPPAVVQRWFRLECPGKLLEEEPETREDLYAYKKLDRLGEQHLAASSLSHRQEFAKQNDAVIIPTQLGYTPHELPWLQDLTLYQSKVPSYLVNCEEVNLKLRQGNLELKLRQQELGIEQFGEVNHTIWEGKIEQWCKLSEDELKAIYVFTSGSISEMDWIAVYKCRQQKIYGDVASELTRLRIDNESWWSVAFEMTKNPQDPKGEWFKKVVKQASQSYSGPKLTVHNSYSYSRWQALATS